MRTIDRKTLRDLSGMKGQAIAIALVVAAGVATFVAMTSVVDTLERTLATYYREYRFADGFASITRAPQPIAAELSEIPGAGRLETRVTTGVNLEVAAFDEPIQGRIVSVPQGGEPSLNRLFLRDGRWPRPGEDEVILNETFAEAHGLEPGGEITAIIAGKRRALGIAGVGLSPEFLMQIEPGSLFPDPARYGVMWMGRERLAALSDMEGAFNDVAFTLAPGARADDVLGAIDRILAPYGGQGAYAREDQASHFLISEELTQLRGMASVLPTIFLLVAAFLLNIVVTRVVSLEREVIAVLKAFGYRSLDVGLHYLKLVLLIALPGAAAGTLLGLWMGRGLSELYLEYYRFPFLDYELRAQVVMAAVILTAGASLVGAAQAVRRAAKLAPAEAMRPPAPATYRRSLIERAGLSRLFDQPSRMILRQLERNPVKSLLAVLGTASACAILILGLFWQDSIDEVIAVEFGLAQRDDLSVSFREPASAAAVYELARIPGVRYAERSRQVPVRLRHEQRRYDTAIEGLAEDAVLRRVMGADLEPIRIPERGLVLSERLAELLGAEAGDEIMVEVREGTRQTRPIQVVGLAQQFLGLGAYMNLDETNRLAGNGDAITGARLTIDWHREAEIMDALRDRPEVLSIVAAERAIDSFMETAGESMLMFTFILSLFAGVIAFGVIYSHARISLAERSRELATLRVLGFSRAEIAYILLGELALLTLVAIPVGLVLGTAGAAGAAAGLQTELYEFPAIIGRATLATAAIVVLAAAALSALIVARRLWHLDLVEVLKTRE